MDRTIITKSRQIPDALNRMNEFIELSDGQRLAFRTRLIYIEQITEEILEWLGHQDRSIAVFLDAIELLLYVNQGAPTGAPSETVSAYMIHSSWTFQTTASKMRSSLPAVVVRALNAAPPTCEATSIEIADWLQAQNTSLIASLNGFYGAKNVHEVMSCLVAIDATVCALLLGAMRFRLNA